MPLPVSGPISFNAINVELGVAGTTTASLNQTSYRTLAGVPSGTISLSNFYGKANQFNLTISTNQTNANLRTLALNAGWNGTSKVVATINSGVYVSSNSTGTPGLTISGSFPNTVSLINNGYIIGMGGVGGAGSGRSGGVYTFTGAVAGSNGSAGGLALLVSTPVSITNNSTIGGGGGGGGGGRGYVNQISEGIAYEAVGGGGGGGGRGGATNVSGGAGGAIGTTQQGTSRVGTTGGTGTSGGAGGGGAGGYIRASFSGGAGGAGGSWGAGGSSGSSGVGTYYDAVGLGGPYSGGAAGAAVSGNGNITWVATGTRLGAIS